jgi:glycosyltransferase involved in cell wall biosynthesis
VRLAIVASHPVQYQAPLFRALAQRCDLHVLFAHRATKADQAAAGFNVGFDWDVDLTGGFVHTFLTNVARRPGLEEFSGCDTPEIGAALQRLAPDAALLMGWHLKCYWQAIWDCRRAGIPVMVRGDSQLATPRGLVKRASKALIYPMALRVFDAALYVGEQSRRYWVHYGYPADRMYFSPHCIDNDWFAARATAESRVELRRSCGIADAASVVLFAGKLAPFKRVSDMVDAAALNRTSDKPVELLIAGAGELEESLRFRAFSARIPFHVLGFCNQSRMPSAYAAADVLVLPSSGNETWGLVANEALACGKPVIVSDACGCAADLAADGTAGAVFRCGNVEELAAAMRQLIERPPSLDAIAAKARRYSLEAAADGILEAARALQPAAHRKAGHG